MQRSEIVIIGYAMAPLLLLGALSGCRPDNGSNDTSASTEAFKVNSPACVSARDACQAQAQPLVDGIKAACAPVEAACAHHLGQAADAGSAVGADASTLTCADARAACANQVDQAKAALQAAGDACAASIQSACTVNRGTDAAGGDLDAGTVPPTTTTAIDAGAVDAGGANPCKTAQQSCHQQLGDIRSMPPAACAAVQTACRGQGFLDVSDDCKMAAAACQSALQSTVTSTLNSCGAAIAATCLKHAP